MKKLLLLVFCLMATHLFSQRFREIVKWEIATENGGRIIGASINEAEANRVITDFAQRNKGKKYSLLNFKKMHTTVPVVKKTDNPIQDIVDNTKRGYIVVSPAQAIVLKEKEKNNVAEIAIAFNKVSSITVSDAIDTIKMLKKYQIDAIEKSLLKTELLASN